MQRSAIPIIKLGWIQLGISGITQVWNGWSIYLKFRTSGMCGRNKNKNVWENRKRGYEGQIEDPYLVEKLQRKRGPIQSNDQIHSQVVVAEAPNKMQEW